MTKTKHFIMWAVTAVTLLITLAGSLYANDAVPRATQISDTNANVQVITSDASGLQFNLQTLPFEEKENGQLEVAGLSQYLAEPGAPALPYYATYIALPPDAQISVQVQPLASSETAVSSVSPAPDMVFTQAEGVGVNGLPEEIIRPDEAIYGQNALYPQALFTVSEPMYYRDVRLVALQLFPVRYNPVTNQVWQAQNMAVTITFSGGRLNGLRPSPHHNTNGLDSLILNYAAARPWRALPQEVLNTPATTLPLGVETFKIALNADGIYDVCQPELAAAGMNVGSVNPNTIQMLYRGETVSYTFIGDSDTSFETDECVRFYGWKFAGPRTEKQFVNDNVYWLWADGTASEISTVTNDTTGTIRTSVWYTETKEPELDYFSTWTNQWPTFDNEPDAFYWDRVPRTSTSGSYTINLDEADDTAPTANFLLEFSSAAAGDYTSKVFTVGATLNGAPEQASRTWYGRRNVNLSADVATTTLINGVNTVATTFDLDDPIYLNRITVTYMRQLQAENNQFVLTDELGGEPLQIPGFSTGNALVWNITDPLNPVAVNMTTGVSGGGGNFVYTFGTNHAAGTSFIATTEENVQSASTITEYVPASLDPADNMAEWLLITHPTLLTEANQLATHRANAAYGGLDTHIVSIDDIVNQYGYGLPLPAAVHDYLAYALGNWSIAPSYVVMFGDATINPRRLPCSESCTGAAGWDVNAPYLVMTDLPFSDRFQGLVPSDHTFVLLAGNDPLADMAIGRIAVETSTEAANAVRKMITYEADPPPANPPFLFIADNEDPDAGDFCAENALAAAHIPGSFTKTHMCQGSATYPDVPALRAAMFPAIDAGVHTLNFRGHGSINRWAGGADPIMTTADTVWWSNIGKPTFVLSADCLDGHFAWPGYPSISETFFRYDSGSQSLGSAGMWSSTGLGYTSEHTILHSGFYDGIFDAYAQTTGIAISYAKLAYFQGGSDESELYTFTLQGDPAMTLNWALEPPPPTPTHTPTPTDTLTPTLTNTPPPGASLTPTPTLTNTPPPGASLTPTPTLTNTPPPGASLTPTPPPLDFLVYLPIIIRP